MSRLIDYLRREPVAFRAAILAVVNVIVGSGLVGPGLNTWTAAALAAYNVLVAADMRSLVKPV